jgi:hypothetical protein
VTNLTVRDCRWIAVPGAADARGRVNFLQLGAALDFPIRRLFWLNYNAPDQWHGRRAHRQTRLMFVALRGSCRARLDDGASEQRVTLDDPTRALQLAPRVWHEVTGLTPDCSLMVIASTPFDEADTVRDYQTFKRELARR